MPLVIMQPTADASSYMLKENFATNGAPGVVDHAVLADTATIANSVDWSNVANRPPDLSFSSEGDASTDINSVSGTVLFIGVIPNPLPAIYTIREAYVYAADPLFPPSGRLHFDVFDTSIPGWVDVTASADIAVLHSRNGLLRPALTSVAMTTVYPAAPNSLQWRVVLDLPTGMAAYFRVGTVFEAFGLQTLP
jgi:hypothetical protein